MGASDNKNHNLIQAYNLYADMLYRLALAQLNSPEDAEDAVHDVFMKYISAGENHFKDSSHKKAWLIRVTVNRCHDILRGKKYRNHVPLESVYNKASEEDGNAYELVGIISTLTQKYKDVIILHYLEGFSVDEIANTLGISPSGVKMRLSRGRIQLKNILEKETCNDK